MEEVNPFEPAFAEVRLLPIFFIWRFRACESFFVRGTREIIRASGAKHDAGTRRARSIRVFFKFTPKHGDRYNFGEFNFRRNKHARGR